MAVRADERRGASDEPVAEPSPLQEAVDAAGMGTFAWHVDTRELHGSESLARLFGVEASAFPMKSEAYLALVHPDDRERLASAIRSAIEGSTGAYMVEHRVGSREGAVRWVEAKGRVHRDENGVATRLTGLVFDVSPRKEAEQSADRAERLFRAIVEDQSEMIVRWRPDGTRTFVNQAYCRTFGGSAADHIGSSFMPLVGEEFRARVQARIAALTPADPLSTDLHQSKVAGGELRWQEWSDRAIFDKDGKLIEMQSVGHDVTDRLAAEAALRRSNRALRTLSHGNQALARATSAAELYQEMCNAIVEEGGYQMAWVGLANDDAERTVTTVGSAGPIELHLNPTITWSENESGRGPTGTAIRTGKPCTLSDVMQNPSVDRWRTAVDRFALQSALALPLIIDGKVFGSLTIYALELDAFQEAEVGLFMELAGDIAYGVAAMRARDARAEAEKAREAGEALLRLFIKHTPAAVAMFDRDVRYLQVSERWRSDYHLEGTEIIGRSHYEVFPDIPQRWRDIHQRALAGQTERCDEDPFHRDDGGLEWLQWEVRPWFDADGSVGGIIMFTQVITERKRIAEAHHAAERALRESEERLRQLAENLHEVFWLKDVREDRTLYISPAYEKLYGRPVQTLYDSSRSFLDSVHRDDRQRVIDSLPLQARGDWDIEFRIVRDDGSMRWVHARAFPIPDADGSVRRVAGVTEDITDRRRIEEQYLQSQKMEAVGQLAGGIAHDFNNILLAMMLQVQLAVDAEGMPPDVRESLMDIEQGAKRAANLTRQLLQFSRKQVMQPTRVDLNQVVTGLAKMVQRVLREDVELELGLYPSPLYAHADASMLDQAIMNLAVNARDAMDGAGKLRIETGYETVSDPLELQQAEIASGRYLCLRVSDTGSGMSADTLSHIFEPFFTTKEAGKGTGLGLPTVFGIARQHRGGVLVSSTVGTGTTFRILLPIGDTAADTVAADSAPPKLRGGHETILLVEDDNGVRRLTRRLLEKHGYSILEASNGKEAMAVWAQHAGKIQMLLSNLVMPGGINGRELAARLRAHDDNLKVLMTSGYSPDIAGQELRLGPGQSFLRKPFGPAELLDAVRSGLEM